MRKLFYSVTTAINFNAVLITIPRLHDLYGNIKYTLICPYKDLSLFSVIKKKYINIDINIICEDDIITLANFKSLATKYGNKKRITIDESRIGWYYQQVLKISFAIMQKEKNQLLVMWDADTIPLSYIQFTEGISYKRYGSLIERHDQYYITIKQIFDFNSPGYGYTIQFIAMRYKDLCLLEDIFIKYAGSKQYCYLAGSLVSKVVIKSVINAHGKLSGSLFSEQELIGTFISKYEKSKQIPIMHFRPGVNWNIEDISEDLLKILGYKYLSIENHRKIESKMNRIIYLYCFLIYDLSRQIGKLILYHINNFFNTYKLP